MTEPARSSLVRFRRPLLVLVGATVLALLAASWVHVISSLEGEPADFSRMVFRTLVFWYLWAAFLGPVIWLARRHPIERGRLAVSSMLHLGFAVFLSASHTLFRFGLHAPYGYQFETGAGEASLFRVLFGVTTVEMPVNLFIYGSVLGIVHLLWYNRRLQERELAASHLSAELARAHVRALRMQLNPHFLFNALNSIAMLVRDEKRDDAVETIADLSDLLRYVLEDPAGQEVPLRREIDFVERYLTIERARFQDGLRVSVDASPESLDALVPNLVLQPLVENSIRHGVARSTAVTTVAVSARREDGLLILRVQDDGAGFREREVGSDGFGVGIANTRERLEFLYGSEASLEWEDRPTSGFVVVITIPFHTAPVDQDQEEDR